MDSLHDIMVEKEIGIFPEENPDEIEQHYYNFKKTYLLKFDQLVTFEGRSIKKYLPFCDPTNPIPIQFN
jgi:hypothetical protein